MKSKQERKAAYKKANKVRRMILVAKAGYTNESAYLKYLDTPDTVVVKKTKLVPKSSLKPTIHLVDISDASGSMQGSKYENTKKGIMTQINEFKKDSTVNYTYSFTEFVQSGKVKNHQILGKFPNEINFYGARGEDTPLYRTVFETLTLLSEKVDPQDKVLVKVYTDGGNNINYGYTSKASLLIKELQEKNFTVTFVATNEELKEIVRDLNLDESNTLAVTNDGLGFQNAFFTSLKATSNYVSNVKKGLSVKSGFYKKVGSL